MSTSLEALRSGCCSSATTAPRSRSIPLISKAEPAASRVSPRVVLTVVAFAVFVAADDLTVVTTMLRPIIGDLGIVLPDGLDDAAWIVNAYLIAFVAVMPFAGRISDVLGRRKVFVAAFALFLVGSVIIPHSTRLGPFLVGRVFTALGGGAMLPVGMAILGDVYPVEKRARALGILGAIETLGWVWGPLYGALIVRFLTWRWQFYLNIPFAVVGIVAVWILLADHDKPVRAARIDWWGAATLTVALVALNVALLGTAEIQSVTGLEELTGGSSAGLRWFYLIAVAAGIAFVWIQRRTEDPIIDFSLFRGRNLTASVAVNFLVGGVLVIAMVNVPLFVNVVELDIERAAVTAGWVLSALTASMALTSYLGGRFTEHTWYRPPVLFGLGAAAVAFFLMGVGWEVDTAYPAMAWQLALLGAGIGLVFAPTSAAVIDAAAPERRGTAASLVIVLRLIGLSVGLSGLTAWGLYRFNQLRDAIELPPLDSPEFAERAQQASAELTTSALAETFVAATLVVLAAIVITTFMRRTAVANGDPPETFEVPVSQTATRKPRSTSMKQFMTRNAVAITAALAAVATAAIVLAIVAVVSAGGARSDARATQAELTELRDEVEQLRGGVALFTAQAGQLQESLAELAPAASGALSEATSGLESFETSTIEFSVPIDETIQIETEVVLDRTLSVPINTTLPIDETIETTILVDGPLGVDIPLDITVPIVLDLPIDLVVDIPVNETIPIEAGVPVRLTVPIAVDVAGTELATLAQSLRQGLESFEAILRDLG